MRLPTAGGRREMKPPIRHRRRFNSFRSAWRPLSLARGNDLARWAAKVAGGRDPAKITPPGPRTQLRPRGLASRPLNVAGGGPRLVEPGGSSTVFVSANAGRSAPSREGAVHASPTCVIDQIEQRFSPGGELGKSPHGGW